MILARKKTSHKIHLLLWWNCKLFTNTPSWFVISGCSLNLSNFSLVMFWWEHWQAVHLCWSTPSKFLLRLPNHEYNDAKVPCALILHEKPRFLIIAVTKGCSRFLRHSAANHQVAPLAKLLRMHSLICCYMPCFCPWQCSSPALFLNHFWSHQKEEPNVLLPSSSVLPSQSPSVKPMSLLSDSLAYLMPSFLLPYWRILFASVKWKFTRNTNHWWEK